MLPLALVVLAFGGPLALSALTGALGIGDDFPKVAAGVFAVVFGTLIVWAVMRVPESRPHVVAFLPLYVGLVVATAGSSLEGSKEFYGAAAQVAPVLFLAALIDGKALAVDLPHRVAAGQVLLYLFTAEVTSLLALLDPQPTDVGRDGARLADRRIPQCGFPDLAEPRLRRFRSAQI